MDGWLSLPVLTMRCCVAMWASMPVERRRCFQTFLMPARPAAGSPV